MLNTFHQLKTEDSSSSRWIADESVALVLTSPPYPMIEMWDAVFAARNNEVFNALNALDGREAFRLMHKDLDAAWSEVARVLRPGGWACVNVGDATRKVGDRFQLFSNHTRIIETFASLGFDILPLLLWRKQTNAPNKFMGSGMLPAGAYVTLEHEYILLMRKGAKRTFASADEKLARQESAFFWEERNKWFSDIWDFKGVKQALAHPEARDRSAAFPFELPYRLINMYSVRGDMVFDPFSGTGTTTLAAIAAGRNSIGVDIDATLTLAAEAECLSAKELANAHILGRIKAHEEFVEQSAKEGKDLRYMNTPHGFRVMTSQEVNLRLLLVEDVKSNGAGQVQVSYRMPASDLSIELAQERDQLTLAI